MYSRTKWAAILVVTALVLGAFALPALAEEVRARWGPGNVLSDVAEARKAVIAELVAAGKLTPEQAQAYLEWIPLCAGEGGGRGQRLGKGCGLRGGQRWNP